MTLEAGLPLAIVALAIGLPLVREYVFFRREWGVGRLSAGAAAFTLFPALVCALAVTQPLAERPAVQWLATIVVTILAYSLVTALLKPAAVPAPERSR